MPQPHPDSTRLRALSLRVEALAGNLRQARIAREAAAGIDWTDAGKSSREALRIEAGTAGLGRSIESLGRELFEEAIALHLETNCSALVRPLEDPDATEKAVAELGDEIRRLEPEAFMAETRAKAGIEAMGGEKCVAVAAGLNGSREYFKALVEADAGTNSDDHGLAPTPSATDRELEILRDDAMDLHRALADSIPIAGMLPGLPPTALLQARLLVKESERLGFAVDSKALTELSGAPFPVVPAGEKRRREKAIAELERLVEAIVIRRRELAAEDVGRPRRIADEARAKPTGAEDGIPEPIPFLAARHTKGGEASLHAPDQHVDATLKGRRITVRYGSPPAEEPEVQVGTEAAASPAPARKADGADASGKRQAPPSPDDTSALHRRVMRKLASAWPDGVKYDEMNERRDDTSRALKDLRKWGLSRKRPRNEGAGDVATKEGREWIADHAGNV